MVIEYFGNKHHKMQETRNNQLFRIQNISIILWLTHFRLMKDRVTSTLQIFYDTCSYTFSPDERSRYVDIAVILSPSGLRIFT